MEKKSRIWFRKIWSRKKIISLGFGEFGLGVGKKSISFGKKYRFQKKVSVSENLVGKVSVSVSVKILVSSFSAAKHILHLFPFANVENQGLVSKNKAIAGQTAPLSSTHMSKKDDITRHIDDPTKMNKKYVHKKENSTFSQ